MYTIYSNYCIYHRSYIIYFISYQILHVAYVEKSKNVTENSIAHTRKISHADVCKASKKKDVKEGERKDMLKHHMQK